MWPLSRKPKMVIVSDKSTTETREDKYSKSVALTERGKVKFNEFSIKGPEYEILSSLHEHSGVMTLSEIAKDTNMEPRKVLDICRLLLKAKYIKLG